MTKTQRNTLESIENAPRFPAKRFHRTYFALVRLGLAEKRLRQCDERLDWGFAITDGC